MQAPPESYIVSIWLRFPCASQAQWSTPGKEEPLQAVLPMHR